MVKRSLCMLLAIVTLFSLAAPAFAEEAPIVTEEPVVTEEPIVTEIPVEVTEVPVMTEEPVEVTEGPIVTEAPVVEATEGPVEAEEPVVMEEPVIITEEPIVTEGPVEIPEVTEVPDPVEEPEAVPENEPATVAETVPNSGKCGPNLTWTLSQDGTLTISGEGKMDDYSMDQTKPPEQPWLDLEMLEAYGLSGVYKVVIKDGVTSIGNWAFYPYYGGDLTSVTIPNSVTSIGDCAFYACNDLTSVTIPDSVTSLGAEAFFACTELKSITLGKGLTKIGDDSFNYCPSLTSVVIPNGVKSIGDNAFYNCGLTSVTIPGSVKSIGKCAFTGCPGLTSVTIEDGVETIGGEAFMAEGFQKVVVPASVTSIGECAFGNFFQESIKGDIYIYNPNCKIDYNLGNADEPYSMYGITPWTYTVHGYDGSTAEAYAKAFDNITFVSMGKAPGTAEDTNLSAPKLSGVSNAATGVSISWKAVSGAAQYRVFYKGGSVKSWKKLADTTGASYTWTKAKSGTKYSFTVRCLSKDGKSYTSAYDTKGKTVTYVAAPKLSKVSSEATGVKISWGKVSGAVKYRVFYKGGSVKSWTKLADTTSTSYTWKKAKSGTKYTFTVRCITEDGKSYTSAYDTKGKTVTYVAAPTVKIAKTSGGIKVTWNKVAGASKYMVYYKEGSGKWTKIGATSKTTYTWKKAVNGKTYAFTVRCTDANKKLLSAYKASNSLKYKK